jgi:hypothetical protein
MTDVTGGADMQQGSATTFTSDRFGNVNSALSLNGGWTQVMSGIYFNTIQFSISAWVYPQNVGIWSRVIDFGNGIASDNIFLSLDSGNNLIPGFWICIGGSCSNQLYSSQPLVTNTWQFVTVTFNGITMSIYLNGIFTNSMAISFISLPKVSRTNNYIGQSNFMAYGDAYSSSYIDELRFYNISLTQIQIQNLMNQQDTSNSVFCATTTAPTTTPTTTDSTTTTSPTTTDSTTTTTPTTTDSTTTTTPTTTDSTTTTSPTTTDSTTFMTTTTIV